MHLAGDAVDFAEIPEMRADSLDKAAVETLRGLDEIKVHLFGLATFYSLLAVLLSTKGSEIGPEGHIHFDVTSPQAGLNVLGCRNFDILKEQIQRYIAKPWLISTCRIDLNRLTLRALVQDLCIQGLWTASVQRDHVPRDLLSWTWVSMRLGYVAQNALLGRLLDVLFHFEL